MEKRYRYVISFSNLLEFYMLRPYLKSSFYFDYQSEEIQNMVAPFINLKNDEQKIEQLYLFVRDGWRYNPYVIGIEEKNYVASKIFHKKEAHCIDKAILYIAGLRALEIPARLRLAKVSNHIATERLEEKLGTNELAPHGLVDVFHEQRWVKCSPAFNKELCDLYNVEVLNFDGSEDSILQEYNKDQSRFMSYIEDYGHFEDVPLARIKHIFSSNYPELYNDYLENDGLKF